MRILPVLLALLLLSLPLGAAESDGSDGDGGGDDCRDASCEGGPHGGDSGSDGPGSGNETADGNETRSNATARPEAYCRDHPGDRRCEAVRDHFEEEAEDARGGLRHVSFEVDQGNRSLLDYRVDGLLAFDAIRFADPGVVEVERHGAEVRIETNESRLDLQDGARGNMEFKSRNHTLVLDLPSGAVLDRHGVTERGHFLVIDYGAYEGKLAADRLVIDGDVLTVHDFAAYHLDAKEAPAQDASPVRQAVEDAIERAEEQRQLGARVSIRAGPSVSDVASGGAGGASASPGLDMDRAGPASTHAEVTEYDDMEVNVSVPEVLEHDSVIDVVVSAELDAGRTVALELDPSVLDGLTVADGADVAPRYYDLNDDGTWTEVVFRKAGSIADILDATDDEGQPEYWIVQDEDGLQVLVSFPHWSTHRVSLTLQEVVDYLTQPSVLVGVAAGVGGVLVAAVAMFLPRRREEDLY